MRSEAKTVQGQDSKMAFTPGPYRVEVHKGDEWWFGGGDGTEIVVLAPEGHPLVVMAEQGDQAKANARLIAAAPELYGALYKIAHNFDVYGPGMGHQEIGLLAKAAIAKVEGK